MPAKVDKSSVNSADCPIDVVIDEPPVSKTAFCRRTVAEQARPTAFAHLIRVYITKSTGSFRRHDLLALELAFFPHSRLKNIALPASCLLPARSQLLANISHLILIDPIMMPSLIWGVLNLIRHTPYHFKFTLGLQSTSLRQDADWIYFGASMHRRSPTFEFRLDSWRQNGCWVDWTETLFDCGRDAFTSLSARLRHLQRVNLYVINMREYDYKCLLWDFPELGWLQFETSDITDQAFVGAICPKLMNLDINIGGSWRECPEIISSCASLNVTTSVHTALNCSLHPPHGPRHHPSYRRRH